MEWKENADLEEMIIDYIKAGFLSNEEILEEILESCEEDREDNYPEECDTITEEEFLEKIELLRTTFQNTGNQENFRKLDTAFTALKRQGIVALHYVGYTQSEGFEDCNEVATELYENGEKVIGCCFYTEQDLGHILQGDSALFYFSFGNYFETPTAEEIGQIIVEEFQKAGFCVEWDKTAKTKIGIKDFKWDKQYVEGEEFD